MKHDVKAYNNGHLSLIKTTFLLAHNIFYLSFTSDSNWWPHKMFRGIILWKLISILIRSALHIVSPTTFDWNATHTYTQLQPGSIGHANQSHEKTKLYFFCIFSSIIFVPQFTFRHYLWLLYTVTYFGITLLVWF